MKKEIEIEVINILKRVLHDLHNKNYKEILEYIDYENFPDLLEFLENDLEEILEDYDYELIDEYGTIVDETDKAERFEIFEFSDGTGFAVEYFISADEELTQLVLQLDFEYVGDLNENIKCSFRSIDYT